MLPPKINTSLGCFPHYRLIDAVASVCKGVHEPFFGEIKTEVIQIVPQLFGKITNKDVDLLQQIYPQIELRLHANVRVQDKHVLADCSNVVEFTSYFQELASLNTYLQGKVYTLHSGRRENCSFEQMLDNVKRLSDWMKCPVGIEGHYPTPRDTFLVASWREYEMLYRSEIPYVIDLSHINILVQQTNLCRFDLLKEMCSADRCLEVHVSDNNGRADSHFKITQRPWWWILFEESVVNPNAIIFSEGKQTC